MISEKYGGLWNSTALYPSPAFFWVFFLLWSVLLVLFDWCFPQGVAWSCMGASLSSFGKFTGLILPMPHLVTMVTSPHINMPPGKALRVSAAAPTLHHHVLLWTLWFSEPLEAALPSCSFYRQMWVTCMYLLMLVFPMFLLIFLGSCISLVLL